MLTHTARSASTVNSSGNSFEISPNVTQTPHVIPQVVHVYVASSVEIENASRCT